MTASQLHRDERPSSRHRSRGGHVWLLGAAALFAVAFAACSGDGSDSQAGDGAITIDPQGAPAGIDNPGALSTTPALRRLSVDQLQATVAVVAGPDLAGDPIAWTYRGYNAYDDRALGKVLGRPDYVSVTQEDTSPSSLYVKFAQDMSRSVCDKMVHADLVRAPGAERTLWRMAAIDGSATDAEISNNLQYLVLRFLGLVEAADSDHIASLRALYNAAIASVDNPELADVPPQAEGWRAVCIALFEDPSFHLH